MSNQCLSQNSSKFPKKLWNVMSLLNRKLYDFCTQISSKSLYWSKLGQIFPQNSKKQQFPPLKFFQKFWHLHRLKFVILCLKFPILWNLGHHLGGSPPRLLHKPPLKSGGMEALKKVPPSRVKCPSHLIASTPPPFEKNLAAGGAHFRTIYWNFINV